MCNSLLRKDGFIFLCGAGKLKSEIVTSASFYLHTRVYRVERHFVAHDVDLALLRCMSSLQNWQHRIH